MDIDPVNSGSEGRASWFSSSCSSCGSLSPSETKPSQPKEEAKKAMSNTRYQLRDCLDNIHDGRFATSGALQNAANPGIFAPSLGLVGLPMSSRDAEVIIDIV